MYTASLPAPGFTSPFSGLRTRAKKVLRGSGGFSLAELAIGLVVLTILIGVVVMAGMRTVADSKITAAGDQMESVQGAIISYAGKYNVYPKTLASPQPAGFTGAGMPDYLATPPDVNKYTFSCDTSVGEQLNYNGTDNAEALAVQAQWSKRIGSAHVTVPAGGTVTQGVIVPGPLSCSAS